MAEERIIIDVDDTAVDMAIAKLQTYLSLSQMSLGDANVVRGAKKAKRKTEELKFTLIPVTDEMERLRYRLARLGMRDLPSLNREMRVILGTIPMMRQAMWAYFGFKREYTQIGKAIALGAISPNLIIASIVTLILLMRGIEAQIKKMRQRQQEYDRWIRRTTGMYRDEYDRKLKIWEHYARSKPG